MTVYELIQHLSHYSHDTRVLVSGHEDGYTEPALADIVVADRGEDWEKGSWWSGRYEREDDLSEGDSFRAVVIGR